MKRFIVAASLTLAVPVLAQAQVISAATWTDLSTVTLNNSSADAYWDRFSSDGASCNIGHYLMGGFTGCGNVKPAAHAPVGVGSLGSTGSFLGTSSLMTDRSFRFASGLYRVDFLANIAGYDPATQPVGQELRAYIGGYADYETVYYRTDIHGAPVYGFDLDASAGDWFFGAFAYGATMTGQSRFSNAPSAGEWNRFALFSTAGASDDPRNAGTWYVGFEDSYNGDRDFNDLIVRVSRVDRFEEVPEPASVALLVLGVGGLVAAGYRRRAARAGAVFRVLPYV